MQSDVFNPWWCVLVTLSQAFQLSFRVVAAGWCNCVLHKHQCRLKDLFIPHFSFCNMHQDTHRESSRKMFLRYRVYILCFRFLGITGTETLLHVLKTQSSHSHCERKQIVVAFTLGKQSLIITLQNLTSHYVVPPHTLFLALIFKTAFSYRYLLTTHSKRSRKLGACISGNVLNRSQGICVSSGLVS